jgi:2-keto-4-pentenoate hydratase
MRAMRMAADGWGDPRTIAARFVEARRRGTSLAAYPGALPRSLDEAYAIQAHAIALRGGRIGGWKLGRINGAMVAALGANRLAGPIFADLIVGDDGANIMPVIAGGFGAAEAEFLLRIGQRPDPARTEWTLADARALVDRVAIGIEIASSPLATINVLGPAVTASDFGNNNGLLVGPGLPGWCDADLDAIEVTLTIDGREAGRGTTATMLDGPWGAVRFLVELCARRGIPLEPGQWISTGAVTGVHEVVPGNHVEASFGGLKLGCTITADQVSELTHDDARTDRRHSG